VTVIESAVIPVIDYCDRPGIHDSDILNDHIAGHMSMASGSAARVKVTARTAPTPAAIMVGTTNRILRDTQEV
jgi:hypothetical protein